MLYKLQFLAYADVSFDSPTLTFEGLGYITLVLGPLADIRYPILQMVVSQADIVTEPLEPAAGTIAFEGCLHSFDVRPLPSTPHLHVHEAIEVRSVQNPGCGTFEEEMAVVG